MNGSRYAARKEWLAALIRDAIATADWFGDWDFAHANLAVGTSNNSSTNAIILMMKQVTTVTHDITKKGVNEKWQSYQ
jgi:hypothetical protein